MGIVHTAAELREIIAGATVGDEVAMHRLMVLQELGNGNGAVVVEGDLAVTGLEARGVVAGGEVLPPSSAV